MSTFNLFRKEVISTYEKKKSQNLLHDNLVSPSPANLRDYCLIRLSKGLDRADVEVFKSFFDSLNEYEKLERAINEYPPGKLKALQKFIVGPTREPKERLVKLLAILVDFQPRPFSKWVEENKANKEYEDDGDVENGQPKRGTSDNVGAVSTGAENTDQDITEIDEQEHKGGGKVVEEEPEITEVAGTAPIVIDPPPVDPLEGSTDHDEQKEGESEITEVASTTPIIIDPPPVDPPEGATGHGEQKKGETEGGGRKTSFQPWRIFVGKNKFLYRSAAGVLLVVTSLISVYLLTPRQCMCWVGDHYEEVDCADKTQRNAVIPIDPNRLLFRKLTTELCSENMRNIWYSKIDHEVEFFTGPGHHPVHTTRSLKAVTPYMWEKHAQCKPSL